MGHAEARMIVCRSILVEGLSSFLHGINNNCNEGEAIIVQDPVPDVDVDNDHLTPPHKWDAMLSMDF